jgi:hypothetical protein
MWAVEVDGVTLASRGADEAGITAARATRPGAVPVFSKLPRQDEGVPRWPKWTTLLPDKTRSRAIQ